jgi:hypothetical protein
MMCAMRPLALMGTFLFAATIAVRVHAEDEAIQGCLDASVRAQEDRRAGKLVSSRRELLVCAAQACPSEVQRLCAKWLIDIDAATPTVVFELTDSRGQSRSDVEVRVDGALLSGKLDGRALSVDPGPHTFTFATAGEPLVTRRLTAFEGEKNRKLTIDLTPAKPDSPKVPPPTRIRVHPAAWALGAVSLAGLAFFAGFGGHSLSLESCQPTCSDAEVRRIQNERIAADVCLSVGAASLAAAAITFGVTLRREPRSRVEAELAPSSSGALMMVRGNFE